MSDRPYSAIVAHYEECLRCHGNGPRAVDWKTALDADRRYEVMLGIVRDRSEMATLLDFGCGLADLKGYMARTGWQQLDYTGLDISPSFATMARAKYPEARILCLDVLESPDALDTFDYVLMNGVFTRRHTLSIAIMQEYLERLLPVAFSKCRKGLAFNVMSKAVGREGDELFHPNPSALIEFINLKLTRHFVLRNDYGLFESVFYLYREPFVGTAEGAT